MSAKHRLLFINYITMPTLLHIDSSPMETSISRELTREFTRSWKVAHPEGKVVRRDLALSAPAPLDQGWIQASFADPASLTAAQRKTLEVSDTLIAELEDADEIVIGVAMHNFAIPSALKLWIDQVVRRGRTFAYTAGGPAGMLTGKKATVLSASGGTYEVGSPSGGMNFVEPYLKAVLGFIGISDITFVTAGGASQLMRGSLTREEFMRPSLEKVRAIAA
jgi:FMN-dependent NADH-azoreductase